jgi:ADP-glucose pyrophosphorylase
MSDGVLGLIVTGGEMSPLAGIGIPAHALTPFAAQYRLLDFALATTAGTQIRQVADVCARQRASRFARIWPPASARPT